jgi:predicted nucleotidyltransferase
MFDETVIAEAARRLSEAAPHARVILFGSHSRGTAGPHSDLDFLVVEPSVDDPAEESARLRRTLRGLGLFADVVVISEREAEEWREVRGSLIHSALSEGRPIAA